MKQAVFAARTIINCYQISQFKETPGFHLSPRLISFGDIVTLTYFHSLRGYFQLLNEGVNLTIQR